MKASYVAITLLNAVSTPGRVDIFRIVGSGNFVVTYSRVAVGSDEFAVFDIFRLENGLVVEHWNNMEPIRRQKPRETAGSSDSLPPLNSVCSLSLSTSRA